MFDKHQLIIEKNIKQNFMIGNFDRNDICKLRQLKKY